MAMRNEIRKILPVDVEREAGVHRMWSVKQSHSTTLVGVAWGGESKRERLYKA
jgi:hypothetical protein